MKSIRKALLASLVLLAAGRPASAGIIAAFPCAGSTIVLLDSAEAAIVSAAPDAYTAAQTAFDRSLRLDKPDGLTVADYLRAAAGDVRTWARDEQLQLRAAFASIDSFVNATGAHLHLPDTVKLIKTTAAEEFGAEGFTRQNRIMLNTGAQPISVQLVAHELWHVISRYNEGLRKRAYAAFHFKPCNNIIYKPALNDQVITNPDCPFLLNYATIKKDGVVQDVALILYAKAAYHPGYTIEQYMNIGLLALTGDDTHKRPLLIGGRPQIYELSDSPDFLRQVGTNTPYMLHIEEITAEHFASLVSGRQLPEKAYVAGVMAALAK